MLVCVYVYERLCVFMNEGMDVRGEQVREEEGSEEKEGRKE